MLTAPDFSRAALITIDVQRDTLDGGAFEVPGTSTALPKLRQLARAFRRAGRPIVHVVRIYRPDGSNVDLCRQELVRSGKPLLLVDSPGVQLAPELLPTSDIHLDCERLLSGDPQMLSPTEFILYKPRWGAFFGTSLEARLRADQITTVVFAGCNFPNCPRTSIYQASERDFRVVLAQDALSGLYDRGRRELANIGVELMDTDAVEARVRVVASSS